jgi:hypothetical protein
MIRKQFHCFPELPTWPSWAIMVMLSSDWGSNRKCASQKMPHFVQWWNCHIGITFELLYDILLYNNQKFRLPQRQASTEWEIRKTEKEHSRLLVPVSLASWRHLQILLYTETYVFWEKLEGFAPLQQNY